VSSTIRFQPLISNLHSEVKDSSAHQTEQLSTLAKFYSTANKQVDLSDLKFKVNAAKKAVTNPYALFVKDKFKTVKQKNPGKV
jgi:hypothetical protein